jgi:xyloglucan-specific endo-beta-1,4-glucanase
VVNLPFLKMELKSIILATLTATVAASPVASAATSAATEPPTPNKTYCGAPNQFEVLFGSPWIIFSMNYNYQSISGSSCTGLMDVTGSGNDQRIHWSSDFKIDPTVNRDVVKGYSFIGLTQGLETPLNQIKSIPTTFDWTFYEQTEWKGEF